MNEPRRLLEQGATDAERALLDAARADGPPPGAAQRMLFALEGLSAGGSSPSPGGVGHELGHPSASATAPMAAHTLKLGAVAKVGLLALVGAGALGGGLLVLRNSGQRSLPSETLGARTPLMQESKALGTSELPQLEETPRAQAASAAGTLTPRKDESLSAEVRILDRARAAVEARDPAAAQRALDTYAQRFPQGHLKPEATVLQLAVLVRLGRRAAAKAMAAQLLANESYRTYAHRIRSTLREIED
jgi:hypothetical protein